MREEARRLLDVLRHGEQLGFGAAAQGQARDVERHPRRQHGVDLRLDDDVAGRDEHPDPQPRAVVDHFTAASASSMSFASPSVPRTSA